MVFSVKSVLSVSKKGLRNTLLAAESTERSEFFLKISVFSVAKTTLAGLTQLAGSCTAAAAVQLRRNRFSGKNNFRKKSTFNLAEYAKADIIRQLRK